ncbi:MAG TPA: GlxA family transcriptional regulator [Solirubrobacteraceae bacterium]|nr:GlxA family transcriptional regulator [Solirubrobacteraceae bacterium]
MTNPSSAPKDVVIVAYHQTQSLDFIGPLEVFAGAQRLIELTGRTDAGYRVAVATLDGKPFPTSSGLEIVPSFSLADAPTPIDTLIVAGGDGSRDASADPDLLAWIKSAAPLARRVASVCTGAFVLAAAGLLDGRRATTHWASADSLAKRFPAVEVDPEPIYVRDGQIWTSAGVTAGMDLSLAMIEEDLDRDAALTIARHLVLFLRRPGNQSQFSASLSAQQADQEPLREVQRHVVENPASDLTVEALAERAHMSPRHFARTFAAETGVTPGRYVERIRLEAARRALEDTPQPIAAIAAACGFGTPETMRRSFLRALNVGPAEYRRRYHPAGISPGGVSA